MKLTNRGNVRDWIVKRLRFHLPPEVERVDPGYGDDNLQVWVRVPGREEPAIYEVTVTDAEER